MDRTLPMLFTCALALGVLSCQQGGRASDDVAVADSAAADAPEGHDRAAAEGDTIPPVPTRESERARDAGEKPNDVLEELGVKEGAHVADVMAGGGYYTYLISDAVGPDGMVYATGAELVSRRLAEGDLRGRTNVKVVESLAEAPAGSLDVVLINRAYHLIQNPEAEFFPQLRRALKPDGRVGIIEVRLGRATGHDMKTHRMGPQTVQEELERAGFRLVVTSELLANPDDPRTDFMEGRRHEADRMFLVFEPETEETDSGT